MSFIPFQCTGRKLFTSQIFEFVVVWLKEFHNHPGISYVSMRTFFKLSEVTISFFGATIASLHILQFPACREKHSTASQVPLCHYHSQP
jgi:hypothetical protein